MRTSLEIRQRLEAAAAKSGRSLAQEVERRIEDSFKLESLNVAERLLVDMHKVIKGFQLQQEKLLEQVLDIRRLLIDAQQGRSQSPPTLEHAWGLLGEMRRRQTKPVEDDK
jgi:hypothetical protein